MNKTLVAPNPYSNFYKMDHENRGIALILNHMYFKDSDMCPTRDGTNKDRDDLMRLFDKFGFQLVVHNDLTYRDICDVLDKGFHKFFL